MKNKKPIDQWLAENSPIPPQKLHALGLITLRWNECEMGLFILFAGVTQIESKMAFAITRGMGDMTMCNRIREALEQNQYSADISDIVRHTLRLYDVNRQNRNILTHFVPAPGETGLEFWKQKGPTLSLKPFPNSLADIRRVADDLKTLKEALLDIGWYFHKIEHGNLRRPLPDKPPIPELLWNPSTQTGEQWRPKIP